MVLEIPFPYDNVDIANDLNSISNRDVPKSNERKSLLDEITKAQTGDATSTALVISELKNARLSINCLVKLLNQVIEHEEEWKDNEGFLDKIDWKLKDQLRSGVTLIKNFILKNNQTIHEAQAIISFASDDRENMVSQFKEMRATYSKEKTDAQNKIDSLVTDVNKLNLDKTTLEDEKKKLNDNITILQKSLADEQKKSIDLAKEARDRANELASLADKLKNKEIERSNLEAQLQQKETERSNLEAQSNQKDKEKSDLEKKIQQKEAARGDLEKQLQQTEAARKDLEEKLKQQNPIPDSNASQQRQHFLKKLGEKSKRISQLEKEINTYEQTIGDLKTQILDLKAKSQPSIKSSNSQTKSDIEYQIEQQLLIHEVLQRVKEAQSI